MRFRLVLIFLLLIHLKGASQGRWYPEGNAEYNSFDTVVAAFYNDTVNGRLYAGGRFHTIGGVAANHIAYWDGTDWNAMGNGIDTTGLVGIGTICSFNNEIYVTGTFSAFNDTVYNNIARWDGNDWLPVDGGLHGGPVPTVTDMCVYNGMLYVVGRFDSAGSISAGGVAAWDGSTWHPMHNLSTSVFWPTTCSTIDSTLVIGGNFTFLDTGSANLNAAFVFGWNAYTDQFDLYPSIGGIVRDTRVFNGELYVGGDFQGANGNHISKWTGSNWQGLSTGLDGNVNALCSYNDSIIAGGDFRHAGALTVNYVALWDGSNWKNLDSGFYSPFMATPMVLGCESFNNRLYAGGYFSYASNTQCLKLAVWPHSPLSIGDPDISMSQSFNATPNPFTDFVTINYTIVDDGPVEIRMFDALGNIVATPLSLQDSPSGIYSLTLETQTFGLAHGVYFLEIRTNESHNVQKVIFHDSK